MKQPVAPPVSERGNARSWHQYSKWDRKQWTGNLAPVANPNATQGVTEHKVFGTNCDVTIDFSEAVYTNGAILHVAVYGVSMSGQRIWAAQYDMVPIHNPAFVIVTAGVVPSGVAAAHGSVQPVATPSRSVVLQATGLGAMIWGLEMSCTVSPIARLWIGSIVHGREIFSQ